MSVIIVLLFILFISMALVGDEKGLNSFFSLIINFIIMYILFVKMSVSQSPVIHTLISCGLMSSVTLFFLNGFHKKTFTALISVGIVISLMSLLICIFAPLLNIQGFDNFEFEKIEYLSTHINIDFQKIVICQMIIAVFSSVTDTAMTISSSMNEIYKLDPQIPQSQLRKSGITIGEDILGTTVNTLFFVYFGSMIILLIWFSIRNTSIEYIINSKLIAQIIFDIAMSSISVIIVIPVSSFITSKFLYINLNKDYDLK